MSGLDLVIFDCDGVLIDSEAIVVRIVQECLAEIGYYLDVDTYVARFVGRAAKDSYAMIEAELGQPLPSGYVERERRLIREAFSRELVAIAGVEAVLATLDLAKCVASSTPPDRLAYTLGLTGLLRWFGDAVFSATMVPRGKPAPDLFFHAAAAMKARPERTLVIEDSPAGILGAKAAGMTAFGFIGGSHCRPDLADRLRAAGAALVFTAMSDLPALIAQRNATLTTS
jgi:HAD superfamily hydrolase (TIGR01509 family)